jgi:hypothetical protein
MSHQNMDSYQNMSHQNMDSYQCDVIRFPLLLEAKSNKSVGYLFLDLLSRAARLLSSVACGYHVKTTALLLCQMCCIHHVTAGTLCRLAVGKTDLISGCGSQLQKVTDKYIETVERLGDAKAKEIATI